MATITLKFDGRNKIAQKALDFILSLGVFEKDETKPQKLSGIDEAMEDIKKGRVYSYKSVDSLFDEVLK